MSRALLLVALLAAGAAARPPASVPVPVPGGKGGVGFDDLGYAAGLDRVLVPAGRTGRLLLADPRTRKLTAVAGFSAQARYRGGHGQSVTSADYGAGLLFATDRTARLVEVLSPKRLREAAAAPLGAEPDYVRYAGPTSEVWVTEPGRERIEVFSLSTGPAPALRPAGVIEVPGGPESLVVDAARGRAYTNLWDGGTRAIDLRSRRVGARWDNGCSGSRGLALDEGRGWVFVGCAEGRGVVLDAEHGGRVLGEAAAGAGVDIIAYDPGRRLLYLPGAESGTLTAAAVSRAGALSKVGAMPTAAGAHCAAVDGRGGVWVCDPRGGRLLYLDRPF
ncbi:MAG: hypothetical protein KGL53_16110 [Elusimicrobia bacterium]|nr:hypothetical protein [Elusimicrobiota bacterium]